MLSKDQIQAIIKRGSPEDLKLLNKLLSDPFYTFTPRPDTPHEFDQQTGFINDTFPGTSIVLKGNGSGGSFCASYKLARNLRTTPPPVDLAKVFVVSELHHKAANLWAEYLERWIPAKYVQYVDWLNRQKKHPETVILQPHKNGNRWQILFRGAAAGQDAFTSFNEVLGFWISEPISLDIVNELQTRCRKYDAGGWKFWELTPAGPFPALEEIINNIEDYPGYRVFRMNSLKNTTLKDFTWLENTPEDLKATRSIGAFANMSGMVFKEFDSKLHVVKHNTLPPLDNMQHTMSLDWGYEHPTCALFCAYDRLSDTHYIYNEWVKEGLLISQKVEQLKTIRQQLGWKDDWVTIADPEDLQQRSEFAALGLPTSIARKEPVSESIDEIRQHLLKSKSGQPRLFISDACPILIRQLRQYRWQTAPKNSTNPRPTPQKVVKVDDDAVDCLRYYFLTRVKRDMKAWSTINSRHA